jgi:hypothetical protein
VAIQVPISSYQASSAVGLLTKQGRSFGHTAAPEREPLEKNTLTCRDFRFEATVPEVIAHGVEFVALPGKAEQLQTVIPGAMCQALAGSGNFSGCMVLVSEQEARLVTVITFWKGEGRAK